MKEEMRKVESPKEEQKKVRRKDIFLSKSKKKLPTQTLLDDNQHKKSKSLADQNLYKIDLDRISKNTIIKERERRRTQKNFVRRLSKLALPSFHHLY